MSGPEDVSTANLKSILEWNDESLCCRTRVMSLVKEVLRERQRADDLQLALHRAKSDAEIAVAKALAKHKPTYQDGIRYAPPEAPRPTGSDGFPQRGII